MTNVMWRAVSLVVVLGLVGSSGAVVQTSPPAQRPVAPAQRPAPPRDPMADEADRLLQAMEWSKAAEGYQQVVRRDPTNAQAWFRLGVAAAQVQDFRRAGDAFEKAGSLGLGDSPKMAWEAAMVYAKLKRGDKTLEWLATVVDGGLRSQVLTATPEFEFVRADPSFQALVARAVGNDRGCGTAIYRGLDFWVGEWAIYDEDRVRVGTNRVAKTPDGCAFVETWTGALGDGGRSLNYYNDRTGRWRQVWIGDTGGVVEQDGEVVAGELRLQGEMVKLDGTRVPNRQILAMTGSGRLRQRAEVSPDGGRTWIPQFEFTYVRITK